MSDLRFNEGHDFKTFICGLVLDVCLGASWCHFLAIIIFFHGWIHPYRMTSQLLFDGLCFVIKVLKSIELILFQHNRTYR